jgi:hypothetical protein
MYRVVEDIEPPCDSSFTGPSPLVIKFVCVAEALVLDVAAFVVVASGAGNPITTPIKPKTKITEIIITLSQEVGPLYQ